MSRLSAVVLTLTALCLTQSGDACLETAWRNGYLNQTANNKVSVFTVMKEGSCQCCALCHQDAACVSHSYNSDTHECQLYSTVAGYDTLNPDDKWTYFVMPGRSQHHQFCREDSDCQTEGDFCRGRVCTQLASVTCRVIVETFGAGNRYGGKFPGMLGWLDNKLMDLHCLINDEGLAYTRLFRNTKGTSLTRENINNFNSDDEESTSAQSILFLEEEIRRSQSEPTYRVLIRWERSTTALFTAIPRQTPVIAGESRLEPSTRMECTSELKWACFYEMISLPYRVPQGDNLIVASLFSQNDLIQQQSFTDRVYSLARTDGQFSHGQFDRVTIHIRE